MEPLFEATVPLSTSEQANLALQQAGVDVTLAGVAAQQAGNEIALWVGITQAAVALLVGLIQAGVVGAGLDRVGQKDLGAGQIDGVHGQGVGVRRFTHEHKQDGGQATNGARHGLPLFLSVGVRRWTPSVGTDILNPTGSMCCSQRPVAQTGEPIPYMSATLSTFLSYRPLMEPENLPVDFPAPSQSYSSGLVPPIAEVKIHQGHLWGFSRNRQ